VGDLDMVLSVRLRDPALFDHVAADLLDVGIESLLFEELSHIDPYSFFPAGFFMDPRKDLVIYVHIPRFQIL
jgi:hypothetical protein